MTSGTRGEAVGEVAACGPWGYEEIAMNFAWPVPFEALSKGQNEVGRLFPFPILGYYKYL